MADKNEELLRMVRTLTDRVSSLEVQIKRLTLMNQDVPEETMVAIAAGVAAYLGHRAKKRQAHFTTTSNWSAGARRLQHSHQPLHLR